MQDKWTLTRLSEILVPRNEKPNLRAVTSGQIPIVAKIAFNTGKIELREENVTRTDMILIKPGDLVVSGINASKGAIAVYETDKDIPAAATIHYSSYEVRQNKAIPSYLWYFLRSNAFKRILLGSMSKGIKTEVRPAKLLSVEISLPDVDEQKRILSGIERAMKDIEEARKLRREASESVKSLFRAVLETIFGDNRSQHWPQKRLNDGLADVIAGQHIIASQYNTLGEGFPYLTGPADFGQLVPEVRRWTHSPKSFAEPGDVLLTVKGAGVGKINFAPSFKVAIGRQIMAIRPDHHKILNQYLFHFLRYKFRYFQSIATETTVPGFKKSDVENLEIPVPDTSIQLQVVRFLNSIEIRLDETERLQNETDKEMEVLGLIITERAIAGKL